MLTFAAVIMFMVAGFEVLSALLAFAGTGWWVTEWATWCTRTSSSGASSTWSSRSSRCTRALTSSEGELLA